MNPIRRIPSLFASVVLLAGAGCGPSQKPPANTIVDAGPIQASVPGTDAGPAPDAGPPVQAPLGAACVQDQMCASNTCINFVPGGYCTIDCATNDEGCPTGSICIQTQPTQAFCFLTCASNADCRTGYVCSTLVAPVCVPPCVDDSECNPGDQCDVTTGLCEPIPADAGPVAMDAGPTDGGTDAGESDAGVADAGPTDAGLPDGGPLDGG